LHSNYTVQSCWELFEITSDPFLSASEILIHTFAVYGR